jgi:hypothetical protein
MRPFILPVVSALHDDDDDDFGETGGMNDGQGNRSTWKKSAPMLLGPPQILHLICLSFEPGLPR